MPVFDFNNKPDKNSHGECTYTMFFSNASEAIRGISDSVTG